MKLLQTREKNFYRNKCRKFVSFALGDYFLGTIKLIKNADRDKFGYSDYCSYLMHAHNRKKYIS